MVWRDQENSSNDAEDALPRRDEHHETSQDQDDTTDDLETAFDFFFHFLGRVIAGSLA